MQKGETLRKIAEQVKPSTVSMEQMLVSLYRQNQHAFSGSNMNRLKAGQILKVPTADDVAAVEQKEANKEIRTQVADWKAYRETLAGGVSTRRIVPSKGIHVFVARDRLAATLRSQGDRATAAKVKAMRRPTLSTWRRASP